MPDDVTDGVGDGGVEENTAGLHARQIDADQRAWLEGWHGDSSWHLRAGCREMQEGQRTGRQEGKEVEEVEEVKEIKEGANAESVRCALAVDSRMRTSV